MLYPAKLKGRHMRKFNQTFILGAILLALFLGREKSMAQAGAAGAGAPGAGQDPQQFMQQMQQRMMTYFRDRLAVTNDEEWKVIEPRVTKVLQLRMATLGDTMGGMGGMRGGNGGQGGGARRGFPGFGQPSPEAQALQKAVDDKAPAAEIKAALAKLREARKRKDAELAQSQDELRQILSTRQEAIMVSMGLLD
jgi:hypothetical protein